MFSSWPVVAFVAGVKIGSGSSADSSRFWPARDYRAGGPQPSFDKQFVRDYCAELGWDKTPPGPELPDDVVAGTRERYVQAFELLTGCRFEDYVADPSVVLR